MSLQNSTASPFYKLSLDHLLMVYEGLSTPDLYHLVQTSRSNMKALQALYKDIELSSPSSAAALNLLQSMTDPEKTYRTTNLRSIRIEGVSPQDKSPLPTGRNGSSIVDDILEKCLPEGLLTGITKNAQPKIDEAYRKCRASLHASERIGPSSLALAISIAEKIKSIEWLMVGASLECTPLELTRLIISAKVACCRPVFPELLNLVWRVESHNTCLPIVPLVPSLQRLVLYGVDYPDVSFDLAAMVNGTKSQLVEVALLGMNMVAALEGLVSLGHLHRLRILRMRDFSRGDLQDYGRLFRGLRQSSPQLQVVDLDFDYMDLQDRTQPTIPQSLQPELEHFTSIKYARIHIQLLWSSPFNVDLPRMYSALPPNLQYLMLVGLDLDSIVQLDEDETDNLDPFSLRSLCAILPHLKYVAFRFDFNAHTIGDISEKLQLADQTLRSLIVRAKELRMRMGIYVCCLEDDDIGDIFYMGSEVPTMLEKQ